MTPKTRICAAVAMAVVFFATLNANAQSQQAHGITLLGSSIETQSDSLTLISEVFLEAFPSFDVPCPKTATKGCTLRIDVSAVFQDTLASGAENVMVTVTGANLPRWIHPPLSRSMALLRRARALTLGVFAGCREAFPPAQPLR